MSEEANTVRSECREAVQWITIDREERRNAINEAVIASISEGLRAAMNDPEARAAFSAPSLGFLTAADG